MKQDKAFVTKSFVDRNGFTLGELLVVISIIIVLLGLLLPAVQAARESSRKTYCQNNLKQIGIALANYESSSKSLPAAALRPLGLEDNGRDQPRTNWAIAILPMLEQDALYRRFDSRVSVHLPIHETVRATRLSVFLCASDPSNNGEFEPQSGVRYARGNYAANFGSASWGMIFWKDSRYRGAMGQNVWMKLGRITDGLSNTVAVGELLAHPNRLDNRGVWAFHAPGASSMGLDCDVQCQGINGDPNREWIPFCAVSDDRFPCSFQNNEFSNAGPRSKHSGGAHFALCDGSVRFVSAQSELNSLVALFTSGAGDIARLED